MTNYQILQTRVEITPEQAQELQKDITDDLENSELLGSFLNDNCTAYVRKKAQ